MPEKSSRRRGKGGYCTEQVGLQMNQSENGLANSGVPKPYDSDSAISPLARAVINEHIKSHCLF